MGSLYELALDGVARREVRVSALARPRHVLMPVERQVYFACFACVRKKEKVRVCVCESEREMESGKPKMSE